MGRREGERARAGAMVCCDTPNPTRILPRTFAHVSCCPIKTSVPFNLSRVWILNQAL